MIFKIFEMMVKPAVTPSRKVFLTVQVCKLLNLKVGSLLQPLCNAQDRHCDSHAMWS